MANVSREMGILKEKGKETLEVKNITEMKNTFDWLIRHTKERISELEDMWVETSQTEKQRDKRLKEIYNRIYRNCMTTTGVTYT